MSREDSKLACVLGWPIAHSKSPALHGHWLKRYGVRGHYIPLPVRPDDFEDALQSLPKLGFRGANVTIPHKEAALRCADEATPRAARLGAANMLTFHDGRIHADNSDGFGFIENLRAGAPDWRADRGPAVVYGAGGAARAIVAALGDAGAPEIRLVNRTLSRADALACDIDGPIRVMRWENGDKAAQDAALLVNTTALGMEGQPPFPFSLEGAASHCVANDIVYTPLVTPFLERARARGLHVVDGLGMLLHQARPGFEAWFGRAPEVDDALRRAVLEA